jgi:hypothetical protein
MVDAGFQVQCPLLICDGKVVKANTLKYKLPILSLLDAGFWLLAKLLYDSPISLFISFFESILQFMKNKFLIFKKHIF